MDKVWTIFQGVGSLMAALLIAYFTYLLTLNSQKELSDYKKRQQSYTRLLGLRFPTKQLYVSRFEARILSDFYEARWRKAGQPRDSFEFQEAVRWMHQSEELVFKIIDNQKELFSCIGDIQVLFKETDELNKLVEKISSIKGIIIKTPDDKLDSKDLEEWKTTAVAQLQSLVDAEYGEPIDQLSAYLKKDLKK